MKMLDNNTIDDYDAKLSGIAYKSATLREDMSEHKLVKKFLTSLPRRFIHIVAALEQVLDLKTTGFEDVVNLHNSSVTVHETNPESKEYNSRSDNMPNPLVQLETIRLLTALAARKGWKIHHLDVKTAFINGNQKKLDSTLKELGTSLDCINKFKRRMASQFEMSNLGKLTYYLGTISFGIKYKRGNDIILVGYSSHNVDIDDGQSTTGHVFYLGTSLITWCLQKETTMVLSSCEAEFMAATAAVCQAIWLREVLAKVIENEQVII
nr:copia protein [Tanacetum cinerariifolium]